MLADVSREPLFTPENALPWEADGAFPAFRGAEAACGAGRLAFGVVAGRLAVAVGVVEGRFAFGVADRSLGFAVADGRFAFGAAERSLEFAAAVGRFAFGADAARPEASEPLTCAPGDPVPVRLAPVPAAVREALGLDADAEVGVAAQPRASRL